MTPSTIAPALVAALASVLVALAPPAPAQEAEPDEAIAYRQNVMRGIGGPAGNVGKILGGRVPQEEQLGHALALLAAAAAPDYTIPAFRQDTAGQGFAETTALPRIWENWQDFEARLRKLGEVTQAAADAGADATGSQIKEIFDTCKGCHDEYREDN